MNLHAAPLTAVPLPVPGVSPSAACIPPDPSLPPSQRNWHERFPWRDYVELAAVPAAVPSARHRLRLDLREWGLQALLDDAELVTTEIVTNAVQATQDTRWPASRPPVRMWLRAASGLLFVLVWDGSASEPTPASAGTNDETGRGLLLIDACSRWGFYRPPGDAAGKVIWAQLPKRSGEQQEVGRLG
jgi:anti-sigma regulatory factor (Ser/Thr protein kinase)